MFSKVTAGFVLFHIFYNSHSPYLAAQPLYRLSCINNYFFTFLLQFDFLFSVVFFSYVSHRLQSVSVCTSTVII